MGLVPAESIQKITTAYHDTPGEQDANIVDQDAITRGGAKHRRTTATADTVDGSRPTPSPTVPTVDRTP